MKVDEPEGNISQRKGVHHECHTSDHRIQQPGDLTTTVQRHRKAYRYAALFAAATIHLTDCLHFSLPDGDRPALQLPERFAVNLGNVRWATELSLDLHRS